MRWRAFSKRKLMERNSAANASFLTDDDSESGQLGSEISFEQLENFCFAPGDITWKGKLTLCSAGDVVDHSYLLKFSKTQNSFPCHYRMYSWNVEKFCSFMTDLSESKAHSLRDQTRINFLAWFRMIYWLGKADGSLLDLMEGAHRSFFDLPKELEAEWKEKSLDLYRVYSLQGALMVCFSLALGYVDYKVLKDIYHLPFFFDSGLLDKLNFNYVAAISEEWQDKGKPLHLLKNTVEKKEFEDHSKKPFVNYPEVEEKFFHMKNLLPLIMRHHEKTDGSGFPDGLNWSELSDLEALIVFVSQNYGLESVDFNNENTCVFLYGRVDRDVCNDKTLSPRLEAMLVGIFKNLDKYLVDTDLIGA
jgi:hypothetical protein